MSTPPLVTSGTNPERPGRTLSRREVLAAGAAFAAATAAGPVAAQGAYPSRPVRVIVPWPAGGNADLTVRPMVERMGQALSGAFVVENKVGGTGIVGARDVARAAPDGHTLLELASTMITGQALSGNREVDALRDFEPIGLFAITPMILEVHPSFPPRTVQEMVAYVKANPGKVACASPSVGSTGHLLLELMKQRLGLDITHVPYPGGAQGVAAIIGGHVQMYFDVPPTAIPAAREGRVRMLAVTSAQRAPFVPDVPTFTELGIAGMEASVWLGMMAPKGTPAPIVARLNEVMNRTLADPMIVQRFHAAGSQPSPGTPEVLAALAKSDLERWTDVVRRAGIKPNS